MQAASTTLSGHVGIISGGLGAIGSATVRALARNGADVAWCDIGPREDSARLAEEVKALGRRAHCASVDIADPAAVAAWVDWVDRDLGIPSLIIPNAAIVEPLTCLNLTPEAWRRVMSVNLDGAFHLALCAIRKLVASQREGRVVFIGSWAAEHVHLQIPAYCVAKAGLRMLAKCLAGELAPHGILVNEIAPGFVNAGLADKFASPDGDGHEESRRQVPTGLLIRPEEVAAQVVHLCDPANRHMTGSILLMDGGLSLFGSSMIASQT